MTSATFGCQHALTRLQRSLIGGGDRGAGGGLHPRVTEEAKARPLLPLLSLQVRQIPSEIRGMLEQFRESFTLLSINLIWASSFAWFRASTPSRNAWWSDLRW